MSITFRYTDSNIDGVIYMFSQRYYCGVCVTDIMIILVFSVSIIKPIVTEVYRDMELIYKALYKFSCLLYVYFTVSI